MWTADARVPRQRAAGARDRRARAERGFTFVEVAVYMVLFAAVGLAVERTMTGLRDSTETLSSMGRVQERAEEIAYRLRNEVSSSRRLFFRGSLGNGYLESLDLGRAPPAPSLRLPLPDEYQPLGVDDGEVPRTGNALLFVREGDPFPCSASATQFRIRYIDVYRFVCVYPHETAPRRVVVADAQGARDLVLWKSAGYPSYPQLRSIQDATERARVVRTLRVTHGFRHAWNPEAAVDSAFYALDTLGGIAASPEAGLVIPEDLSVSRGSLLVEGFCQLARTDATSLLRRSLLTADDPQVWVPDGFEAKIVGASGNRQVWMRLCVESQSRTAREVAHANAIVATARDL